MGKNQDGTEWGSAYGNWDADRLDAAQQAVIDQLAQAELDRLHEQAKREARTR